MAKTITKNDVDIMEVKDFKCSCGQKATYICKCGCLCCGGDPCQYGCGGFVIPLAEGLGRGIKPKIEPE